MNRRGITPIRTLVRRTSKTRADDLDVHPILKDVYCNRNVSRSSQLEYSLANLSSPNLLFNIEEAAQIIVDAVQADASILITGDFDADGATGSALGYLALKAFGARKVQFLCPDRQEFGYGLSEKFVEFFAPTQPDLVITVDNGISSIAGVRLAKELGMSVVVTDHHLPGDELPVADAIVNPRLPGDQFPSKNLAGVGVMFYVMLEVRRQLRQQQWFENEGIVEPNMSHYLDLVALGTIADVVSLDDNNRILVAQGLKLINENRCRYGIRCLLEEGGKKIGNIVSEDLAFVAGPRLNAAGRLDDISHGIRCLISEDQGEILNFTRKLEKLNNERKEMEAKMVVDAEREIKELKTKVTDSSAGICLYNSSWHQGIIGVIASRIRELTGRPTIIFASAGDGYLRGSGRSVKGLNLRDVLANIVALDSDVILQFGGHAMAAGMTLEESALDRFNQLFQQELLRHLDGGHWEVEILSDGEISQFDLEVAEQIRQGGPWGKDFETPVFDGIFTVTDRRLLNGGHLKLKLRRASSRETVDGIYFRYSNVFDSLPQLKDYRLAFELKVNEYRGRKTPQLNLVYMEEVDLMASDSI